MNDVLTLRAESWPLLGLELCAMALNDRWACDDVEKCYDDC